MADIRETKFWVGLIGKVLKAVLRNMGFKSKSNSHHQHVVPHEKGWAVRGEGNERLTGVFKYQDEAIVRAREIARNNQADVIIHRKDGTIRDRMRYD